MVDLTVTRWYHCVSRCVRKAFSLEEGDHNRSEWLENRLEELGEIKLVEYTGQLFRQGKSSISAKLAGIFERLGFTAESWQDAMGKPRGER